MLTEIAVQAGIFLISLAGIGLFIRWSRRKEILAIPNERSSHTRPVPVGAGVIIAGVCVLAWVTRQFIAGDAALWSYAVAAVILTAVSWWDDIGHLPELLRLFLQILCAGIVIAEVGYFDAVEVPLAGVVPIGWAGVFLTFVCIVGITNAYNFMDGIDGNAGLQAVVAALLWTAVGMIHNIPDAVFLGFSICAATLGFLVYNWSPARVFMGDSGSAFLGFSFGCLPLIVSAKSPAPVLTYAAPALGVAFLWPFVFDFVFTLLRRASKGGRFWAPHKTHLYQRIIAGGWSHSAVATLYGVGALAAGSTAFYGVVFLDSYWPFIPVAAVISAIQLSLAHKERLVAADS